jgi:hypothetical protein
LASSNREAVPLGSSGGGCAGGAASPLTGADGVLDGPVVVVVNNKVFSQFRYEKGKKVVE